MNIRQGIHVHCALQAAPLTPNQVEKKKCWEAVQPLLLTDSECIANCSGLSLLTSAGPVKAPTLVDARIA